MFGERHEPSPAREAGALVVIGGATVFGAAQTNVAGPILAFAGALMVAVVAAVTAGRRQQRDLAAAGERHAAELTAEAERLQLRLDADRRLKDIDDLRKFFDEGARLYEVATMSCNRLSVDLDPDDDQDNWLSDAVETMNTASPASDAVEVFARRVALRFAPEHPLAASYAAIAKSVTARFRSLLAVMPEKISPEQDTQDGKYYVEARVAWQAFSAEARKFIGATAPPEQDA